MTWLPPEGASPNTLKRWNTPWGFAPQGELPPAGVEPELRRAPAVYDLLGRKQPRRFGILTWLLAIPGFGDRVRRVPARAIEEEREIDGVDEALVSCPCGRHPTAAAEFVKCPGCERAYIAFGGGRVFVFYLDMEVPPRS